MNFWHHLKFEKHLVVRRGLPVYVIFFVTEKCVYRCRHCFLPGLQGARRRADLSLEEISRISASMGPLLTLLPTGGEPFLRDDLPEIIRIFHRQNDLRFVGMPTSGHDPEKIVESVTAILDRCPDLELDIEVSLDGFENTHNLIRQNSVSYAKALATYEILRVMAADIPRLSVGITSVFSSCNQQELLLFYRHLRDIVGVENYAVLLARGGPDDRTTLDYDLGLFAQLKDEINADLKRGRLRLSSSVFARFMRAQRIIRNNLVHDIARRQRYMSPCHAGNLAAVIRSDGEVYPCESREASLGSLRDNDYDFTRIWNGEKARRFAESRRKNRCFCTHECFLSTNILFNKRYLPQILWHGLTGP